MITPGISARTALGALIKEIRKAQTVHGRPMTQFTLGQLIGCSQAKIQKMESAQVKIELSDIELIIGQLDPDKVTAAQLRKLAAMNAVGEPWSKERALIPAYARQYMEYEQLATEILSWHEARIPGPLQSTHFMLRQFGATGQVDVAPLMRNRESRKGLFHRPDLKRYACVLGEEALRRAAHGLGRDVMLDQIDHLLSINDPAGPRKLADGRTGVYLLPVDAAVPYLENDFSILRFADAGIDRVYIEYVGGGQCLRTPAVVTKANDTWQAIARAALDRDGTQRYLWRLRQELAAQ